MVGGARHYKDKLQLMLVAANKFEGLFRPPVSQRTTWYKMFDLVCNTKALQTYLA